MTDELKCRSCGRTEFRAWYPVDEGQTITLGGVREDGTVEYDYDGCTEWGESGDDESFWCLHCEDNATTIEELVGLPAPPTTAECPSDEYHPVIAFDGAAYDSIANMIHGMRGYGVTLTMEDSTKVDALLEGSRYNDETGRLDVTFYRVTDGDYPTIESVSPDDIEQAFVRRVQVH